MLQPRRFDACPICGDPTATEDEHVPPGGIGGKMMTWTCKRCNNNFSSKVEVDLLDWVRGRGDDVVRVGDRTR